MNDEMVLLWARCPYPEEICNATATMQPLDSDGESVACLLTCMNGHRWLVTKVRDTDQDG